MANGNGNGYVTWKVLVPILMSLMVATVSVSVYAGDDSKDVKRLDKNNDKQDEKIVKLENDNTNIKVWLTRVEAKLDSALKENE